MDNYVQCVDMCCMWKVYVAPAGAGEAGVYSPKSLRMSVLLRAILFQLILFPGVNGSPFGVENR